MNLNIFCDLYTEPNIFNKLSLVYYSFHKNKNCSKYLRNLKRCLSKKITSLNIKSFIFKGSIEGRLDLSNYDNLTYLNCSDNKITSLSFENPSKIEFLDCSKNTDIEIDLCVLNNVKFLNIEMCTISSKKYYLDVQYNTKLKILECSINRLNDLKLNKNLRYLSCNTNGLEKLDVRDLHRLIFLDCKCCFLKELYLNNKVKYLFCELNFFNKIDIQNLKLESFSCDKRILKNIDISTLKIIKESNILSVVFLEKDRHVYT